MTTLPELIGPDASNPGEVSGYWRAVKQWSLGGNDKYGDCVFVALANLHDLVTSVNGVAEVMSEAEAEHFYSIESGFSPLDGKTDHGALWADVLLYWELHGRPGDPELKAVGWCEIERSQIHTAVHGLGAVCAWAMLPSDGDGGWDFSDGALHDGIKGTGPHAFLVVESGPDYLRVVTWGQVVRVSLEWWTTYGRDCYAVRHPAWKGPR